ncbi:hypothetical protein L21SP3_01830 [Sedimentisphaera cyanobacteriorum]|uniref:DUF5320 domain-containing protein n=1 Tax=Sedimentisphaera cyanobacteriorum TaxID=1940790 RepID=A0A1Q2HRB6_9BACT|nr:DUF5320 domain-containing protein [Sedimentisphaera cyanobacteriorum]AQQ10008.1 hypothetical protein L21SP3_01830 [Sedimentisphaera cyanobacteriorum]
MPRGDRTGPAGLGPMTGRAAGYCTGSPVPGFMNGFGFGFRGGGRGLGRGFGRGFGFGRGAQQAPPYGAYNAPAYGQPQLDSETEKQVLEDNLSQLKEQMSQIEKRLESLK